MSSLGVVLILGIVVGTKHSSFGLSVFDLISDYYDYLNNELTKHSSFGLSVFGLISGYYDYLNDELWT